MIPDCRNGLLPPGIHKATWPEIGARFGASHPRRSYLLDGLARGAQELKDAGCATLWIDGSYVTDKQAPRDFDACWDPAGVDPLRLDPVLKIFTNDRALQKMKYGGEFFPATNPADTRGRNFLQFFQEDRSGVPKGIVELNLRRFST